MSAVPIYLTTHPRWLLWRTETRIDRKTSEKRATKVPISYHTGKPCDVTTPASWTDYDKVQAALARTPGAWDGAGFALGLIELIGEVVIGLDSDTCLNEDGSPAEWAVPFLDAWGSYAEISPGGVGIKGIARIRLADLSEARRLLDVAESEKDQARTRVFGERVNGQHAPSAQLFLMARYFTVTGRHWVHSPEDVTLLSLEQIAKLGALFGPKEQRANGTHREVGAEDDGTAPDEAALREKLQAAFVRNPRLKERWEGGTQGLNDTTRSGRDMSILAMLVTAGFTKGETRAALCWFDHGKVKDEPLRYFGEMWRRTKAAPRQDPEPPDDWEKQHPANEGKPKRRARTNNILALVTYINTTPAWDSGLRFNLLTENYEICPPFPPQDGAKGPPRPLRDPHDLLTATLYFQANGFPKANKHVVWDAIAAVAHQSAYHPVRDHLSALRWDGVGRVNKLFEHYFNAEVPGQVRSQERDRHVAYLEQISTGFLVGAVARVMQPGCKQDHVPVVVGKERLLKSSAIRALCHDDKWFSDDISPNLIERDTKESLSGKWIIELAEIPHIRREAERVKAFFSRRDDRYRSAYGKVSQDHPRQCVFIGSSNNLEFVDVTGNRRFWPFRVAGQIDVAAIITDRDPHPSPHSARARNLPNSPLPTSISANRCISGSSRCSGMFGISS